MQEGVLEWLGEELGFSGRFQIIVGDFDGDGEDDLFWVDVIGMNFSYWVLWSVMGSWLKVVLESWLNVDWVFKFFVGDFDGDGCDDVLIDGDDWSWFIKYGNVDWKFFGVIEVCMGVEINQFVVYLLVGDVIGDGKIDIFWFIGNSQIGIWFFFSDGVGFRSGWVFVSGGHMGKN